MHVGPCGGGRVSLPWCHGSIAFSCMIEWCTKETCVVREVLLGPGKAADLLASWHGSQHWALSSPTVCVRALSDAALIF